MTKAGVKYEFRWHAFILEPAIKFKGIGRWHAFVTVAMLDEGWRRGFPDVCDRRRLGENLGVIPWRCMKVVMGEQCDVRIDVIGHPVADARTDGNCLKAVSVRRKERRNVAA